MSKKVIQISYDFYPQPLWGVASHLDTLVDCLSFGGIDSIVITRNRTGLPRVSIRYHATILRSNASWDKQLLENPFNKLESYVDFELLMAWNMLLGRWVVDYISQRKIQPWLVHNHTWMTWRAARYISDFFKIPIVSSVHFLEKQYAYAGNNPTLPDQNDILEIENAYQKESDALIVFSRTSKELLRKNYKYRRKVIVIPHEIDITEVESITSKFLNHRGGNVIRILFVGRLVKEKGIFDLLAVAEKIIGESSNVIFTFVGSSSEINQLKKTHENKRIIFTGRLNRDKLYKEYALADIACLPSYTESFGLTIVEAMAFGLPLITTAGPTVPHYVENMKTGLTINLKCGRKGMTLSRQELYKAIRTLVDDERLRKNLGSNAQYYAEKHFSLKKMGKKYVDLYEKLALH